jgi:ABC-type Fe3+ transport system permease subunit
MLSDDSYGMVEVLSTQTTITTDIYQQYHQDK